MKTILKLVAAPIVAVLVGCTALAPVVAPVAETAACFAADALKGYSLEQIQSDCKSDEASVVTALLAASDAGVKASPAYGEAVGKAAASYKAGLSK